MTDIECLEILRNIHINDNCHGTRLSVVITKAIIALQEKAERENPKPLTITLEQAANAIQIICNEGGCPPDTDCPHDGNCAECIKEWLISVYKPNHSTDVGEMEHSGEANGKVKRSADNNKTIKEDKQNERKNKAYS